MKANEKKVHKFTLNTASLERKFSVYIIIAKGLAMKKDIALYVGKTGDNRMGCNPIISRCGNHFSYNKIHSQMRNKITSYLKNKLLDREYTFLFVHFYDYDDKNLASNKIKIYKINEAERQLNKKVQDLIKDKKYCKLLNKYSGKGVSKKVAHARSLLLDKLDYEKLDLLVDALRENIL